jgi:hypothetical protein
MVIKPGIRFSDELSVKLPFGATFLASGQEQHGLPSGIKGEKDAPPSTVYGQAEFFHVGMPGSSQRVCPRASQRWALLPQ